MAITTRGLLLLNFSVIVKGTFHVFKQVACLFGVVVEQFVHNDKNSLHLSDLLLDDCVLVNHNLLEKLPVDAWHLLHEAMIEPVAEEDVDVLLVGLQQRNHYLQELFDNDDDLFEGGLLDGGSRRRHVLPVEYEVAYVFEEGGFSQLQLVLVARDLRNFIEEVDNLEGEIVDAITEHCKHLA